mmetsp:Transcript_6594/g.28743  ORF Transcript_6594/g.28743 Transcript_6594/m.28743 type:complete len:237 (+) Transcript_6594:29-739(+)
MECCVDTSYELHTPSPSQSKPTGTLTVGSFLFPSMITRNSSNVIPPPNDGDDRPASLPPSPSSLFVFLRSSASSPMARVMSSPTCSSFRDEPTRCFTIVSRSENEMYPSRSTSYTLNMKSSLSSRVALSLIAAITLQKSLKLRFWNTRVTLGASGDIASSGMDMSSSSLMYPLCRLSRVRKRLYRHWISRLLNLPPQCSCTSSTSYCVRFRLDAVSPMASVFGSCLGLELSRGASL